MKKGHSVLMVLLGVIAFGIFTNDVYAADPQYHFGFEAYNVTTACNIETENGATQCFEQQLEKKLSGYQITNGNIEAGEKIMLMLTENTVNSRATAYALTVFFDATKLDVKGYTNVFNSYTFEDGEEYGGIYTTNGSCGRYGCANDWNIAANYVDDGYTIVAFDSKQTTPLIHDGYVAAVFFTVKDTMQPGDSMEIKYVTDNIEQTNVTGILPDNSKTKDLEFTTFDSITLSVASNISNVATLNTLTSTGSNGLNYPFGFVADSTNDLEYDIVVPNAVENIVFSGTPTDSKTKGITNMNVLSGPLETPSGENPGWHDLEVGDNEINIVVTAESGDTLNYKMNVKRLSNDTGITSVTGTNGVSFTSVNETSNSITVPYKTASSDITVVLNHSAAFLDDSTITWTINSDNKNDTTNNYTILVKSEECKTEYASVPGNDSCAEKSYPFEVIRTAPSLNVNLNELKVDGVTVPGFDPITNPDAVSFTLNNVPANKESVEVTATVADSLSTVSGIGTKTLNVGDNAIVVTVLSEDKVTKKEYTIHVRRLSNETKLALTNGLVVTSTPAGQFTPNFVNTFTDYTYTFPANVGDITVSATVLDTGKASVSIIDMSESEAIDNSSKTLNTGTATFNKDTKKVGVIVTAEDGTTGLYTVNFTRLTSSNNLLKSLSVTPGTGLKETFVPETTFYTAEVDSEVTSVVVSAEAQDDHNQGITISGNNNLAFGPNTVTVRVMAENGQPLDYVITVTRKRSNIATLDEIRVGYNGATPSAITGFNKDTLDYELTSKTSPLPYNTTSISIAYDKTNEDATVTGDVGDIDLTSFSGKQLVSDGAGKKVYEYTFNINVAPQDGSTGKIYTLKTYKEANNSTDTDTVSVHGVSATLDPSDATNSTYKVELDNSFETLNWSDITVNLNETTSLATPITTGTVNLVTTADNTFDFMVTAENGETKNYHLVIVRKKSNNNNIQRVNLFLTGETSSSRFCEFQGGSTSCTIEVPVGTSGYRLEAVLPEAATVTPNNSTDYTMSAAASDSTQVRELTVKAEDNTEKKYTVTVKRLQSSNNLLDKLETNANSDTLVDILGTDKVTPNRSISVLSSQKSVRIHVVAQDGASTITSNKYTGAPANDITFDVNDLAYGTNLVTITVTSEMNVPKIYNLTITREDNTEPRLSMITIDGNPIDDYLNGITFDADPSKNVDDTNYTYNLNMFENNVTSIELGATSMDLENGTFDGTGTKTIETIYHGTTYDSGNIYTNKFVIRAFAHDKSIYKDYTINITRKASSVVELLNNAVSMVYDGANHAAVWNATESRYEITVPNSVNVANSSNVVVSVPAVLGDNDAPAKVSMSETTLVTDDETNDNVNIHKFIVTAEDGNQKEYTMQITRELSNNAYLKAINILNPTTNADIGSWTPSFADGILTYSVSVPVSTTDIKIEAEKGESHQNILSGLGTFTLTSSNQTFNVTVRAEDGTERTYALNIVREQSRINSLKSLKIMDLEGKEFVVNSHADQRNRFNVTIPGTVDKIKFEAVSDSALATIVYLGVDAGTTDTYSIPVKGTTTKEFTITSESGAKQKYYVEVTKSPKTDATLKKLAYKFSETDIETEITLVDGIFEYNIPKVSNATNQILVSAETTDSDASIESGNTTHNLKTGNNAIEVKAVAEDGTTKLTYKIIVEREKSSNSYLSALSVKDQTINEPLDLENTFNYTIDVDETLEKILKSDITATPFDSAATVTLDEDLTLVSGANTYSILVTAEDGTEHTYTLTINKPKSTDAKLKNVNLTDAKLKETWDPEIDTYTIIVPYGVTEFKIVGIANNALARVDGNDTYSVDTTTSLTLTVHPEDENAQTKIYTFNVEIAASNEATLTALSVVDYPFTDGTNEVTFESGTEGYSIGNVFLGVNKLVVNASKTNPNATVSYHYNGSEITNCHNEASCEVAIDAVLGAKNVEVRVLAADGVTSKTYTISYTMIHSNRLANIEVYDANGDALSLSETFKPDVTSYKVSIPNEKDSVRFDVSLEDSISTVFINGEEVLTKTFDNLVEGSTTVSIVVRPQDGDEKTYTVEIERAYYSASTDSELTVLKVMDVTDTTKEYALTPSFGSASDNHYSIGDIPYGLTTLNILATLSDSKANIKYYVNDTLQTNNVVTLPNESGTIKVEVTAEDNTTQTIYEIAYTKTPSNNANLSGITVSEGTLDPTFANDTLAYTVIISNDKETIDLIATLEHNEATIKINGEDYQAGDAKTFADLPVGETPVNIVVTAEDGTEKTYVVTIKKEDDESDEKITSVVYGHVIKNDYIYTVSELATVETLKNQLDNENAKLHIFDRDDNELSDTDVVGTGMVVKLIVNDVLLDSKIIIIRGDVDGDGEINIFDVSDLQEHIVGNYLLEGALAIAGDVDFDGDWSVFDIVDIREHIAANYPFDFMEYHDPEE